MDDCCQEAPGPMMRGTKDRREVISYERRRKLIAISQDIAEKLVHEKVSGRELCIVRAVVESLVDDRN